MHKCIMSNVFVVKSYCKRMSLMNNIFRIDCPIHLSGSGILFGMYIIDVLRYVHQNIAVTMYLVIKSVIIHGFIISFYESLL